MKPYIFSCTPIIAQAEPTTTSAVLKPTLSSRAQPAATEQAVTMKSMQFSTPLVAGMYVNTHTPLTSITHARLSEAVQLIRPWLRLLFSCILLATLQPLLV